MGAGVLVGLAVGMSVGDGGMDVDVGGIGVMVGVCVAVDGTGVMVGVQVSAGRGVAVCVHVGKSVGVSVGVGGIGVDEGVRVTVGGTGVMVGVQVSAGRGVAEGVHVGSVNDWFVTGIGIDKSNRSANSIPPVVISVSDASVLKILFPPRPGMGAPQHPKIYPTRA